MFLNKLFGNLAQAAVVVGRETVMAVGCCSIGVGAEFGKAQQGVER